MNITSHEEIKLIMKNLNSINQVMKNVRNDKTYTLSKGMAYAPPNENYDEKSNNENCGWHHANLKLKLPYLDDYTFYVVGNEYYTFYKNYKNDVNSINIMDGKIIFSTSTNVVNGELIFDTSKNKYNHILYIDTPDCKHDLSKIKNVHDIISDLINKYNESIPEEYSMDDDMIDEIKNIKRLPQLFTFCDKYKFRFTKKLLPALNASAEVNYKIYNTTNWIGDQYFIIQFITKRKELDMIDIYGCLNY